MQITPDATEVEQRISWIGTLPCEEILVKETGREEIDLPPHLHDRHQLIYIVSGTLHIEVESEPCFAPAHHLVWIPGGIRHRLTSNNRLIALVTAYFRPEGAVSDSFAIYGTDDWALHSLRFLAAYGRIGRTSSPEIHAYAREFFRVLPFVCPQAAFPPQPFVVPRDSRLTPVLEYVRLCSNQNLTIGGVAAHFGFSVRNLTRLLSGSGIGFVHYLNYHRVIRAIEILTDGAMNVEQTAYEVGFNTPNSFSRVFRQITGESPSMYQRRRRQSDVR